MPGHISHLFLFRSLPLPLSLSLSSIALLYSSLSLFMDKIIHIYDGTEFSIGHNPDIKSVTLFPPSLSQSQSRSYSNNTFGFKC